MKEDRGGKGDPRPLSPPPPGPYHSPLHSLSKHLQGTYSGQPHSGGHGPCPRGANVQDGEIGLTHANKLAIIYNVNTDPAIHQSRPWSGKDTLSQEGGACDP